MCPLKKRIVFCRNVHVLYSRTKNQPKEEVFGTDIPRTSGGHSRGYPGPKLRSGQSKSWKNKHFGADIHDPKVRTSTTPRDLQKLLSEKLWAEFSFPIYRRCSGNADWGRGSGGVKSTGVSQRVRETNRDESQCVPSPEKLFKTRDLELPQFLRDLSQVVRCTPWDTPVPLYTRTSLWPSREVQKFMGNKLSWTTGMLIYLPVTSRPLIFLQKEAALSPCNFATAHFTACILKFYLPLTSRPTKWRTLSQCPKCMFF